MKLINQRIENKFSISFDDFFVLFCYNIIRGSVFEIGLAEQDTTHHPYSLLR